MFPTSKLEDTEALVRDERPNTFKVPDVLNDPPVTELVAVNDLAMFREPAKDEEPVPDAVKFPFITTLPPMDALLVSSSPVN